MALRRAVQVARRRCRRMEGAAHHVAGEGGRPRPACCELAPLGPDRSAFRRQIIVLNFGAAHRPGGSRPTPQAAPRRARLHARLPPVAEHAGDAGRLHGREWRDPGSCRARTTRRPCPRPSSFAGQGRARRRQAGDIVLFDSLVVHAPRPTAARPPPRPTLCFGRPFMKPQMDWPRFLPSETISLLTPCARQLLGYDARVPASIDEYYQPAERWTFKPDQL